MSQNKQEKDKVASEKEIESMCNFIGGFEKWPLLNDDCKRKVLEVMDIYTRISLGMCSKGDFSLMNTTPFYLHGIELDDSENYLPWHEEEEFDNVQVWIKRDNAWPSNDGVIWVFSQLGEDTQVRGGWSLTQKNILKNCNYYEEAVKFSEMWMKRCHFKMERIQINMERYLMDRSQIVSLPKCTTAVLKSETEDVFYWWLQKLPSMLKSLELSLRESVISRDFLSSPQIINAEKLYILDGGDISDEQLLSLKANDIQIRAERITDQGINQFLKRWVNGNGVKGFDKLYLIDRTESDDGEMIKGLDGRLWDADFRIGAFLFCYEFRDFWTNGSMWQVESRVDPFESLTIYSGEKGVYIVHTGHRMETDDGEPYTSYWNP